MQCNTLTLQAVSAPLYNLGQPLVERIAEAYVANHALFKEGKRPYTLGAVNDLVGNNKVPRSDLLLQGPHGGKGDDGAYTNVTEGSDVGLVLDLVGCVLVVETVARDESDRDLVPSGGGGMGDDADGRGRLAPWRVNIEYGSEGEAGE